MTEVPNSSPLKVYVAGAPRSGTSILFFAVKDVFGLPGFGESPAMPAFQRVVDQLRVYLEGLSTVADDIMIKKLNRLAFEEYIFEYIRKFYKDNYPLESWIDKTPTDEAVFGFPLVEAIFPSARLVVTKRNGIEVVTSHIKKFNSSFDDACTSWLNAMKGLLHSRESCQNLLEVDQFEFQNAQTEVSRRLADHLGAPQRAEELATYFASHHVEQSSTHAPNSRLRLDDTNWTNEQKENFRGKCGAMMEIFHYHM